MKKIMKSLLLMAAVTTGMMGFVSCSSDDDLPKADALFRPVITESGNIEHFLDDNLVPYMTVKWDNYTAANQYIVKMEAIDGNDVREITTDSIGCTFTNLKYDTEYTLSLTAANTVTGLSSKPFSLNTTTLDYPTKLSSVSSTDLIDTQARIKWSGVAYDSLQIWKDSNDSLVTTIVLTDADNEALNAIVRNLQPKTTYRVLAFVNDQYLGKKKFTTTAAEDFGDDAVIDLRGLTADESKKYITSAVIAADIEANPGKDITYVLQGGVQYTISDVKFPTCPNRIKFVTGLTLAGNAEFISSAAMTAVTGSEIEALEFEKIDFYAGNGLEDVLNNTDMKFGSKQVFNLADGIAATIGSISFKSCTMTYYRAIVRAQDGSANAKTFNAVTFDDCVLNGVGDQGVVTTSNKKGDSFKDVTFNNCTLTNIYVLSDFRANAASNPTMTFNNCTLCYAGRSGNQLMNHGSTAITLKIKNTLFGPALNNSKAYTAGETGKLLAGTATSVSAENSYMTTYEWNVDNLLDGVKDLGMTETELWKAPADGDFTIIGKYADDDLTKLGDARWW